MPVVATKIIHGSFAHNLPIFLGVHEPLKANKVTLDFAEGEYSKLIYGVIELSTKHLRKRRDRSIPICKMLFYLDGRRFGSFI